MIGFFRFLVLVACGSFGLMVTGCSFSAPQFTSAMGLARDIIASDKTVSAEEPPIWFASVGGVGAVLNPYVSNEFVVFASTDGDAIAFDGWTIRSVVGFGQKEPLSISGKDGVRTFMVGGQKTQAKCDEWNFRDLIWSQTCSNGPNEIVLGKDGNIQKITMPVGDGSVIVTLRVAK